MSIFQWVIIPVFFISITLGEIAPDLKRASVVTSVFLLLNIMAIPEQKKLFQYFKKKDREV
jgi:hypothetical protein